MSSWSTPKTSSVSPGILQRRSAIARLVTVFPVLPLTKRVTPAQILASASYDDTIKLYIDDPMEDWYCFATLSGHEATVWSLAFSPDGRFLASSSDDLTVRIWERVQEKKWECVAVLEGHERSVYSVSWGKGKAPKEGSLGWLASTGSDGLVLIHELIVRRSDYAIRPSCRTLTSPMAGRNPGRRRRQEYTVAHSGCALALSSRRLRRQQRRLVSARRT